MKHWDYYADSTSAWTGTILTPSELLKLKEGEQFNLWSHDEHEKYTHIKIREDVFITIGAYTSINYKSDDGDYFVYDFLQKKKSLLNLTKTKLGRDILYAKFKAQR